MFRVPNYIFHILPVDRRRECLTQLPHKVDFNLNSADALTPFRQLALRGVDVPAYVMLLLRLITPALAERLSDQFGSNEMNGSFIFAHNDLTLDRLWAQLASLRKEQSLMSSLCLKDEAEEYVDDTLVDIRTGVVDLAVFYYSSVSLFLSNERIAALGQERADKIMDKLGIQRNDSNYVVSRALLSGFRSLWESSRALSAALIRDLSTEGEGWEVYGSEILVPLFKASGFTSDLNKPKFWEKTFFQVMSFGLRYHGMRQHRWVASFVDSYLSNDDEFTDEEYPGIFNEIHCYSVIRAALIQEHYRREGDEQFIPFPFWALFDPKRLRLLSLRFYPAISLLLSSFIRANHLFSVAEAEGAFVTQAKHL